MEPLPTRKWVLRQSGVRQGFSMTVRPCTPSLLVVVADTWVASDRIGADETDRGQTVPFICVVDRSTFLSVSWFEYALVQLRHIVTRSSSHVEAVAAKAAR